MEHERSLPAIEEATETFEEPSSSSSDNSEEESQMSPGENDVPSDDEQVPTRRVFAPSAQSTSSRSRFVSGARSHSGETESSSQPEALRSPEAILVFLKYQPNRRKPSYELSARDRVELAKLFLLRRKA